MSTPQQILLLNENPGHTMSDRMDLKTYLSNREQQRQNESFRKVCLRCLRPQKCCLCGDIQAFATQTRFVILMHPKEAKKTKMGTGRLTHLCLINSELRVGVDFRSDDRVNSLINNRQFFPVVLYPGEKSVEISEKASMFKVTRDRKLLVFVIDASWPLAKKILKQSYNLNALPQIHFRPGEPSRYVIKQQPHPYCLCTIESVYCLLNELGKLGLENCGEEHLVLKEILEKMCRLQSEHPHDSSNSGYRKESSLPSKQSWSPGKRQKRSVSFNAKDKQ